MTTLPPLRLVNHEGIIVVRDDDIPGGTKQRVLERWLPELGPGEYVYASPAEGFAQIAIALTCRALGSDYRAHIFVAKRRVLHRRTLQAQQAGALVTEVDFGMFSNVSAVAKRYAEQQATILLPFGLDAPRFQELMIDEAQQLDYEPHEVWTVVGSGTLTRCLQRVWPRAKFYAVQVGHKADIGRATRLIAPERFAQPAKEPPPFPSCDNYDAKAWQFIKRQASPGALFWNVAADSEDSLEIAENPIDRRTRRPLRSNYQGPSDHKKKEERKMTTATAKYKGHSVVIEADGSTIKVKSWTAPEDGKQPTKAQVGKLVGQSFETVGAAGRASIEAVTDFMGAARLPSDRRMVFYEAGSSLPINARNVGSKPAAKSKTATAVAEKPVKAAAPAKSTRNSRRAGPVTTRKQEAAAPAAPKSGRKSTAKAAAPARRAARNDDAEELDI